MAILLSCTCGKKLKVPDELAGKKVKCPGCGGAVAVQATVEAVAEKPKAAPPPLPPPEPAQDDLDDTELEDTEPAGRSSPKEATAEVLPYWRCNHNFGQRLVVLAPEGFIFASLKGDALDKAEEDLAAGVEPREALGKDAAVLPYGTVTSIATNKRQSSITAYFKGAEEAENEVFEFGKSKERDRAFDVLRDLLEPRWKYARKDYSHVEAALKPLVTVFVLAAITVGLVLLTQWLENQTGRMRMPALAWLFVRGMLWLGPTGVGVVGALIILCCVPWLIMRVKAPPIMLTLTPLPAGAEPEDEPEEE